jgi:hypothetical protein
MDDNLTMGLEGCVGCGEIGCVWPDPVTDVLTCEVCGFSEGDVP